MVKQKIIIRAMMGWTGGILIGMYGALIVMIIMPMNIWLKIFTCIGLFSASLGTWYALFETYRQYKMVIAVEEIEKINNEESIKEVENKNGNSSKEKN